MSYIEYSEAISKVKPHALYGGSNYHWANQGVISEEEMIHHMVSLKTKEIGTFLHELAADHIEKKYKFQKQDRHNFKFDLLRKFPAYIINNLDLDFIFTNLMAYTNDSIDMNMQPEVEVKFTEEFFGSADALVFREGDNTLIIHDLKTGVTKPSLRQLEIYAVFYCLQHRATPRVINLKLYYMNEIIEESITYEDLIPLINSTRANAKLAQRIIGAK